MRCCLYTPVGCSRPPSAVNDPNNPTHPRDPLHRFKTERERRKKNEKIRKKKKKEKSKKKEKEKEKYREKEEGKKGKMKQTRGFKRVRMKFVMTTTTKSDDELISLKDTFGLCEGRAEQQYCSTVSNLIHVRTWLVNSVLESVESRVNCEDKQSRNWLVEYST